MIKNAKPVDKTLVNFEKGTHNKLKRMKNIAKGGFLLKFDKGLLCLGKM